MRRPFGLIVFAIVLFGIAQGSQAGPIGYNAFLDGPSEVPVNASPGTGIARIDLDLAAHTMRVQVTFSGLLGTVTASHIHLTTIPGVGTGPVATQTPSFVGFPSGVTGGSYDHTFDTSLASTYRPGFITSSGGTAALAEAAFAQGLADGKAYLNIHSNLFPGGEIRGFLHVSTPEPATLGMLGIGAFAAFAAFAFGRRRGSAKVSA